MTLNINPESTQILSPESLSSTDFGIEFVDTDELIEAGTTIEITQQDLTVYEISQAKYRTRIDAIPAFINGAPQAFTVEISDPTKVTIDGLTFRGTRVASGTDTVRIAVRSRSIARGAELDFQFVEGSTYRETKEYSVGSLGEHITNQTNAIASVSGKSMNLYGADFSRNSLSFVTDLDCSGIVAYRGSSTTTIGSAVIAPDIVTGTAHAAFTIGSTVTFVDNDNLKHTRTLTAKQTLGCTDLMLWKLDSELPNKIKSYKILPSDWLDYLPSLQNGGVGNVYPTLPIIAFKRNNQVCLRDAWYAPIKGSDTCPITSPAPDGITEFYQTLSHKAPASPRNEYGAEIISGDSGFPAFVLINDELVWVGNHWGIDILAFSPDVIASINSAMLTLGSVYEAQTPDLSGFTNYG